MLSKGTTQLEEQFTARPSIATPQRLPRRDAAAGGAQGRTCRRNFRRIGEQMYVDAKRVMARTGRRQCA